MIKVQTKPERVERGQVWVRSVPGNTEIMWVVSVRPLRLRGTGDGESYTLPDAGHATTGDMLSLPWWHYLGTLDPALIPEER